jgi:hypothetical protein
MPKLLWDPPKLSSDRLPDGKCCTLCSIFGYNLELVGLVAVRGDEALQIPGRAPDARFMNIFAGDSQVGGRGGSLFSLGTVKLRAPPFALTSPPSAPPPSARLRPSLPALTGGMPPVEKRIGQDGKARRALRGGRACASSLEGGFGPQGPSLARDFLESQEPDQSR